MVQQGAVVDGVARKECGGSGVPQADGAGGVAGQVHDLEVLVAQVDHVAVDNRAGDLAFALAEAFESHASGQRGDEVLGVDGISGLAEPVDSLLAPGVLDVQRL